MSLRPAARAHASILGRHLRGPASSRRGLDDAFARAVAEASPDGLLVADDRGVIVYVNARIEAMFGRARAELIGASLDLLFPDELRPPRPGERRDSNAAAPVVGGLGVRGRRRDGSEILVDVSLGPVSTPRASLFVASVRDAAPRRAVEQPLEETVDHLRVALDEAPIGMAFVALDGRLLRVNKALCRIVGYTAEELRGLSIQAITRPADVERHRALAAQLVRGEIDHYQFAARCLRKDGSLADTVLTGSLVRRGDGSPRHYIAQIEDVGSAARAREDLERSEERLRILFEQASDGIFIADLDGHCIDVNPAGCAMLGYAREEVVGKTVFDVVRPEDRERVAAAKGELVATGHIRAAEWTVRREDGSLVTVEASMTLLSDGRWEGIARDVGERRRAEAAAKASEEALNRAQRVAHVGSWDWNVDTNEVRRSREFYALFGRAPAPELERVGVFASYIHPDEREEVTRRVNDAIRARSAFSIEHRIVRADGEERVVRQQGEPVVERGKVARMVGTVLDITHLRRAERDREASLRRFRAVFDQCPVGIILVRGAGDDHVEMNHYAEVLLGRPVDQVALFGGVVLGVDERPLPVDDLPGMRARRGERVDGAELLFRQPSGNLVPVLASAAPLVDPAGAIEGAVVAVQDITAPRQLERLRAEWSSIVAHDLRQPLNAVALSSQLLLRSTRDDPQLRALGERILSSSRRLDRMIRDLMDLSRLEAARLELARERVDVLSMVRSSIDEVALDPSNPPVVLRCEGVVGEVMGDRDRLMQVMSNLLSNAIKYGRPGAPVVVEVVSGGREVRVAVTNEGEGIAPDALPRLFKRFERAQHARQSAVKGVGLGLHISRGLVEAHGGHLDVDSTPGATTTFRFTLPIA